MRTPPSGRGAATWRHPAFASGLAVLALLVFSWPLAIDPPPTLREAFVHLFGAWIAVVLALWHMSSMLRFDPDSRDGERHD